MPSKKIKPFAFCGLDAHKNPIIKDLKNVDPANVPGTLVTGQDDPPGSQGKLMEVEMVGYSKNPSWVNIGGRWYKIG